MESAVTGIVGKCKDGARRAASFESKLVFVRVVWSDGGVTLEEFDDIEKMFSEEIVAWLDNHYPKMLTVETAVRWGLADSKGSCVQYTDDNSKEYQVAGCVLASGEVNGWEKGRYYVSDRRYGGPDTFWEAPFFTISSFQASHRQAQHIVSCRYNIRTHSDNTITIETTPESKAAFLESVDQWCLSNLDRVYDLSATGARSSSEKTERSGLLTPVPVYCKTSDGDCSLASVINMLYMEEGPVLARAMLDLPPPQPGRTIGSLNTWLEGSLAALRRKHGLSRTYSLRNLPEDITLGYFEPADFVARVKKGKYVVRLSGVDNNLDEVDHTVYVDADRQLVLDCTEKRGIRLCYEALECCVGDAFLIGGKEIREVLTTKLGSGNRAPRRKKRARKDL